MLKANKKDFLYTYVQANIAYMRDPTFYIDMHWILQCKLSGAWISGGISSFQIKARGWSVLSSGFSAADPLPPPPDFRIPMESQKESLNLELSPLRLRPMNHRQREKAASEQQKPACSCHEYKCSSVLEPHLFRWGERKRKRDGLNSCQLLRAIRVLLFVVMRFKKKSYGFLL